MDRDSSLERLEESSESPPRKRPSAGQARWSGKYCCVPLCKNTSSCNDERVRLGLPRLSFFSFPRDDETIHKQWLVNIRRADFVPGKYSFVCSEHFCADDYKPGSFSPGAHPKLVPSALPRLFQWNRFSLPPSRPAPKARPAVVAPRTSFHQRASHSACGSTPGSDSTAKSMPDDEVGVLKAENEQLWREVERLELENCALRSEVEDLQEEVRHLSFSLERFKDSDSAIIFYTGFPDYSTLETFYGVCLSDSASNMRQWRGKHTSADPSGVRPGPKPALPPMEQFFVVLARLRLGLQEQDLADRLLLSQSVVSAYTRTWLNFCIMS